MRILRPFLDAAPAGEARVSSHTLSETTPPLLAHVEGDRDRLVRAAVNAGLVNVAELLKACGRGPIAWDQRPGEHAPLTDRHGNLVRSVSSCGHRLCDRCARKRAATMGRKLGRLVKEHFKGRAAFLTLTRSRAKGESLGTVASELLEAFTRFREYKLWKATVRGGYFVVHFAGEDGHHVHLHVVVDIVSIDQKALDRRWKACLSGGQRRTSQMTGRAHIEWVRDLSDATAYMLRPPAVEPFTDEDLASLVGWMRKRRLVQTFGCLYGVAVREPRPVAAREQKAGRLPGRSREVFNSVTGELVPESLVGWQRSALAQSVAAAHLRGERLSRSDRLPDDEAAATAPGATCPPI